MDFINIKKWKKCQECKSLNLSSEYDGDLICLNCGMIDKTENLSKKEINKLVSLLNNNKKLPQSYQELLIEIGNLDPLN